MNKQDASFLELEGPCTPFCYPDDEKTQEIDREAYVSGLEQWTGMIFSGRTERSMRLNASVGIAILKGDRNLEPIARHFRVTTERVRQVYKEIQRFQAL